MTSNGEIAHLLAGSQLVGKRHEAAVTCGIPKSMSLTIVVFGASGDLAKKKTLPAIFTLFSEGFFPDRFQVVGYARSPLTDAAFRDKFKGNLKGPKDDVDEFLSKCFYVGGAYDKDEDYVRLADTLREFEGARNGGKCHVGRLFYLALPPGVYPPVAAGIKKYCNECFFGPTPSLDLPGCPTFWSRVIVEKPFGRDLDSAEEMARVLGDLFPEKQIYRIDHYLGKELAQNMLVLRFANQFFEPIWSRNNIANVQLVFKEPFGTDGRGGYFDSYGIIRDIMQNHLMQILTLVAMERPVSLQPDDIRGEKLKVLRCMSPVTAEDTVLGQYVAANGKPGYTDDDTVPPGSNTPTYACCVLRINNPRWAGVPFIMRAGKALDARKAEIRIQFKPVPALLFPVDENQTRNELVMRIQPDEAIYMKTMVKKPGLEMDAVMSELDLSYNSRYKDLRIPDAYERLLLDAIRGDQQHFVRRDELAASWAIWTPILHSIERGEIKPKPYPYGSRGPPEVGRLLEKQGYVRTDYTYQADGLATGSPRSSSPAPAPPPEPKPGDAAGAASLTPAQPPAPAPAKAGVAAVPSGARM